MAKSPQFAASRAAPLSPWLPVFTGFVAAEMTAYLFCRAPAQHAQSWTSLLARSVAYVALMISASLAGVLLPGLLLRRKPSLPTALLVRITAAGCLFFPCIAILFRQFSVWIVLAVGVTSVVVAHSLERLASAGARRTRVRRSAGEEMQSLYGLPAAEFNPLPMALTAACVQGTAILLATGYPLLASSLFAACVFLAVWRWRALNDFRPRRPTPVRAAFRLVTSAVGLTFLSLLLWFGQLGQTRSPNSAVRRAPESVSQSNTPRKSALDYAGVILLTPPIERKEVLTPPKRALSRLASLAKPIVIPFDGPYWYFKAPNVRPAADAHIAHGQPTEVNVHSSDLSPLLMEAHQTLDEAIDLECCGEVDVELTNADSRRGRIAIGVFLSDSTAPASMPLYLGQQTIASSETLDPPTRLSPRKEVLHFPLSSQLGIKQFDEMTVLFLTDGSRSRSGAHVSIQSFVLIPK